MYLKHWVVAAALLAVAYASLEVAQPLDLEAEESQVQPEHARSKRFIKALIAKKALLLAGGAAGLVKGSLLGGALGAKLGGVLSHFGDNSGSSYASHGSWSKRHASYGGDYASGNGYASAPADLYRPPVQAPVYGPPPAAPAPIYRPPASAPVYGPPTDLYRPPAQAPAYIPPPAAGAPIYRPPAPAPAPVYGPPAAGSGNTGSNAGYSYNPPSNRGSVSSIYDNFGDDGASEDTWSDSW